MLQQNSKWNETSGHRLSHLLSVGFCRILQRSQPWEDSKGKKQGSSMEGCIPCAPSKMISGLRARRFPSQEAATPAKWNMIRRQQTHGGFWEPWRVLWSLKPRALCKGRPFSFWGPASCGSLSCNAGRENYEEATSCLRAVNKSCFTHEDEETEWERTIYATVAATELRPGQCPPAVCSRQFLKSWLLFRTHKIDIRRSWSKSNGAPGQEQSMGRSVVNILKLRPAAQPYEHHGRVGNHAKQNMIG